MLNPFINERPSFAETLIPVSRTLLEVAPPVSVTSNVLFVVNGISDLIDVTESVVIFVSVPRSSWALRRHPWSSLRCDANMRPPGRIGPFWPANGRNAG